MRIFWSILFFGGLACIYLQFLMLESKVLKSERYVIEY